MYLTLNERVRPMPKVHRPTPSGTVPAMTEDSSGAQAPFHERITRQGEETITQLATQLLENPLINGAISRAFEAREKAAQAQEAALGVLQLPTAADIERQPNRVRSVSQRLEGIEAALDRVDERIAKT